MLQPMFDTVNMTNPTDYSIPGKYGVQVVKQSDSSDCSIASLTVNGNGISFRIVLNADPGEPVYVQTGLYGYTTTFIDHYVQTEQPRCNLRDSASNTFDYNGFPDYGWMAVQSLAVT